MRQKLEHVLDRVHEGSITMKQLGEWLATHGESISEELSDKETQITQLNEDIEGLLFENDMLHEELMFAEVDSDD